MNQDKCKIIDKKEDVVSYIKGLNEYEGYVQFSHRAIDEKKDIFKTKNICVENEKGFIYEANFYKDNESISIKQINDKWYVDVVDTSGATGKDIRCYKTKYDFYVKMAQIWKEEDESYDGEKFKVSKLKKVVFAGFEDKCKGDKS